MAKIPQSEDMFNRAYKWYLGSEPDSNERRFTITHLKAMAQAAGGAAIFGASSAVSEIRPWEVEAVGVIGMFVGGLIAVEGIRKAYKNMTSPITPEEH